MWCTLTRASSTSHQNLCTDYIISFLLLILEIICALLFSDKHKLLFGFQEATMSFYLIVFITQLSFSMATHTITASMDNIFARLDLQACWALRSKQQYASELFFCMYCVYVVMVLFRRLPNHVACDNLNVCTCSFATNSAEYGCA